ncbi:hypothetical protein B0H14DRAFT_3115388 [Mycena olivaceomarginata]|nr:hypothetical protein B0H14DRAFT_3115388 [Mycena olivaceomarginata]
MSPAPRCKNLVLDAGPLLSLSPLRGLAETYLTVPQVLAELKDKRAREHFERLGLSAGVKVEVVAPDAASLAAVIAGAKKTGDYAVLSHPDLCVLALTYSLHQREKAKAAAAAAAAAKSEPANEARCVHESVSVQHPNADDSAAPPAEGAAPDATPADAEGSVTTEVQTVLEEEEGAEDETESDSAEDEDDESDPQDDVDEPDADEQDLEPLDDPADSNAHDAADEPLFADPGITPSNVGLYKSRASGLLPESGGKGKGKQKSHEEDDEPLGAGCMTADFAMQNGKRIQKVKSWVLRCHACFKPDQKILPLMRNPTLLRASVTISAPSSSSDAPTMQIHLKKNFQYRTRGTKYAIPAPKAGSAKTGTGEGLILREDQTAYVRAKKMEEGKRAREEVRINKGIMAMGRQAEGAGAGSGVGSWLDPDWMPEMLSVGAGGKGRRVRQGGMDGDLPAIGYGRKNPNASRKKRK